MRITFKGMVLLVLLALLPRPAKACDLQTYFAGVILGALALEASFAASCVATGVAGSVYSAKEYQKDNADSKIPSLAAAVLNPIGSVFSVIALSIRMMDHFSDRSLDTEKKYAGAASMMALLATGLYAGASIASGVAYGANKSFETTRALGLSLAAFATSIFPSVAYVCQHLKKVRGSLNSV